MRDMNFNSIVSFISICVIAIVMFAAILFLIYAAFMYITP